MSGTSADGIDVAICRITPTPAGTSQAVQVPRIKVLGHLSAAYPKQTRALVLRAMDAEAECLSVAELSRLNWKLGTLYADVIERARRELNVKLDLVACHGQTIHHEAIAGKASSPDRYGVRATWQIGEASVIAERLRVPVVSDFRPADLAAGGQGAPLVPMLDYVLLRDSKRSRILLNLGGIANVTAVPAGGDLSQLQAFDTGPANMVIDAAMALLLSKRFDRGGATARGGKVLEAIVERLLAEPYFSRLPPKSCGREEYGRAYTARLVAACKSLSGDPADTIATATALTAASIHRALVRFVLPHLARHAQGSPVELIAAGGGVNNRALMAMLKDCLEPLDIAVRTTEAFGIPPQAKEAVAFALLGWLTWHRLPGNVPAATGASRPVVLGKVTFA